MQSTSIRYSVVIPTHARPELVRRAALSALVPEHAAEVIVVEDRTHDAADLPSQLASQGGKLRYIFNDSGLQGASATRNFGVMAARGKFIVFLDDDDEFVPGYLDTLYDLFLNPPKSWGFADQVKVSASGGGYRKKSAERRRNPFQRKIAALSAGLWIENSLFQNVGGLDPDQTLDEDTDLCCRLIGQGFAPHYLRMDAVRLNRDPAITRLTNSTKQKQVSQSYLRTYSKNIEHCRPHAGAEAYLLLRAHRMMCRSGEFADARTLAKQAKRFHVRQVANIQEMKFRLHSYSSV